MDKIDNLFIRACKSDNPDNILLVYRRFYIKTTQHPTKYLIGILLNICDKYCNISLSKYLIELDQYQFQDSVIDQRLVTLHILQHHIALTKNSDLLGYIPKKKGTH